MNERNLHEKIEWLNYWIEDAYAEKKRILVIGDSVARQYRQFLNEIVKKDGYVVDLIATSRNMFDDVLNKEIENYLIMANYIYDIILYGLGAHHGYWIQCANDELSEKLYRESIRTQINILRKYAYTVIFLSGTPERELSDKGELIANHNIEILARNKILRDVAEEYGYQYYDLFKFVKENNIKYVDLYHFNEEGSLQISCELACIVLNKDKIIDINNISHLCQFKTYIETCINYKKKIYIYGNSNRGKTLRKYILQTYEHDIEGFVVSNDFYEEKEDVFLLKTVSIDNSVIIVTPDVYDIWCELCNYGIEWIRLDRSLFRIMDEILYDIDFKVTHDEESRS